MPSQEEKELSNFHEDAYNPYDESVLGHVLKVKK